jgi:hypothetical protein
MLSRADEIEVKGLLMRVELDRVGFPIVYAAARGPRTVCCRDDRRGVALKRAARLV